MNSFGRAWSKFNRKTPALFLTRILSFWSFKYLWFMDYANLIISINWVLFLIWGFSTTAASFYTAYRAALIWARFLFWSANLSNCDILSLYCSILFSFSLIILSLSFNYLWSCWIRISLSLVSCSSSLEISSCYNCTCSIRSFSFSSYWIFYLEALSYY